MKKYSKAVCVILIATLAACSDEFLQEKKMYGAFDDLIFQSENEMNWYIAAQNKEFFGGLNTPIADGFVGAWNTDHTAMSEEKGGSIPSFIQEGVHLESSTDCGNYYGNKLTASRTTSPYTRIRECTWIINKIDELGKELKESFRKGVKGQEYMFRAIQYFDLMRCYGGVPIVKDLQSPSTTDETLKLPRVSPQELAKSICEDLDEAAKLLPASWGTSDLGRFTRGAALAMKSRVKLVAASPLFNKDWDNVASESWKEALEAGLEAEKQLTEDGYGLYGSSAKDWESMFQIDNSFNKEAIIVHLCSSNTVGTELNNDWEESIRLPSQKGQGFPAPKEMIDLYPLANGQRPTVENGYDEKHFFLNRDPRFYRTFSFSGRVWPQKANGDETVWAYRYYYLNAAGDSIEAASDNNSVYSPAFVCKMSSGSKTDTLNISYSGTDIYEYRYAELLLNIAECYAAVGNVSKCTEYIGKVRARVGIPAGNNYGLGILSDKYKALEACLYERRIELAYEGKRFWDIWRWMLYNDDVGWGNNTCEKLGIAPINGTSRTGNYLTFKKLAVSQEDPLIQLRKTISVNPNNSNFQEELQRLASFYDEYFTLTKDLLPMDHSGSDPAHIEWKSNYYILGLNKATITTNTWLLQTKGWQDLDGNYGTFDYRE